MHDMHKYKVRTELKMEQLRGRLRCDPLALSMALEAGAKKMGLRQFKPQQKKAIECVLRGEDVFVTLPTGFSKSAIYQSLPFCASVSAEESSPPKAIVLVVSPLIALMRDQVASLSSTGVKAVYLSSNYSCVERSLVSSNHSYVTTASH